MSRVAPEAWFALGESDRVPSVLGVAREHGDDAAFAFAVRYVDRLERRRIATRRIVGKGFAATRMVRSRPRERRSPRRTRAPAAGGDAGPGEPPGLGSSGGLRHVALAVEVLLVLLGAPGWVLAEYRASVATGDPHDQPLTDRWAA